MKPELEADNVVHALKTVADERRRPTTRDGRRAIRQELTAEIQKLPPDAPRPAVVEAARLLIDYAEQIGAFKIKTRFGMVVARATVDQLRADHARTGVCKVWPFC